MKYTPWGSVRVGIKYSPTSVELSVQDTGVGIPHASQHRVMERFFRVESNDGYAEGTGIGLAMVSDLVGLMGSSISFESCTAEESDDGTHGSIFRVDIPLGTDHIIDVANIIDDDKFVEGVQFGRAMLDEAAGWSRASISEETSSESGSGDRHVRIDPSTLFFEKTDVLVLVEDNRDMRKYIASLFRQFLTVKEARNGVEALQIIKENPGAVDLILSDVNMPELSGTELLAHLKADDQMKLIPIILLTANSDEGQPKFSTSDAHFEADRFQL